jgi:hypothetical protein
MHQATETQREYFARAQAAHTKAVEAFDAAQKFETDAEALLQTIASTITAANQVDEAVVAYQTQADAAVEDIETLVAEEENNVLALDAATDAEEHRDTANTLKGQVSAGLASVTSLEMAIQTHASEADGFKLAAKTAADHASNAHQNAVANAGDKAAVEAEVPVAEGHAETADQALTDSQGSHASASDLYTGDLTSLIETLEGLVGDIEQASDDAAAALVEAEAYD